MKLNVSAIQPGLLARVVRHRGRRQPTDLYTAIVLRETEKHWIVAERGGLHEERFAKATPTCGVSGKDRLIPVAGPWVPAPKKTPATTSLRRGPTPRYDVKPSAATWQR